MKNLTILRIVIAIHCVLPVALLAQTTPDMGSIHGSLQSDMQYTFPDSAIRAEAREEKILSNTYLQLLYKKDKFEAGARFEMYQTPMLGFDPRYTGQGIPYRFARYNGEFIDITVGNFYEQFGKGSAFRAYQEWTLGIDNSIDGLRAKFKPKKGIVITGLLGKQRAFWEKSRGIVRAADVDLNLNQAFDLTESKHKVSIGANVVSKYQNDDDPTLNLPENVATGSFRAGYNYSKFHFDTEVAYKANDPGATNGYFFNPGNLLYANISYGRKGFAISGSMKRTDNMDFRSDRTARLNAQTLSFLPPITKTHTYRLPTLYPYATQPNGEFGGQINVYYKVKEGSILGGENGWNIAVNYARVHNLDTTHIKTVINDTLSETRTYKANFGAGKRLLFEDFNVELSKEWSDKFSQTLTYIYLVYDKDVVQFNTPNVDYGTIFSHNVILESSYSISDNTALRTELQHMYINQKNQHQDFGNWAMALVELSVSPHWYFTIFDEWNYGNPDKSRRAHYYTGQVAYVKGAHRVSIGYGRQREGLLCVGGICRIVPASNGFSLSLTSSF